MEGISRSSVNMQREPKKVNKAVKHAVNAAFVGTGLYASNLVATQLIKSLPSYEVTGKRKIVGDYLVKFGEMIFPKRIKIIGGVEVKSKMHKLIEGYTKQMFKPEYVADQIKAYKGKLAAIGIGAAAALSVLAAGIYKAGKINGQR